MPRQSSLDVSDSWDNTGCTVEPLKYPPDRVDEFAMARLVFQTENSRYEVDEAGRRFRRFGCAPDGSIVSDEGWCPYVEAGRIERGERVRFVLDQAALGSDRVSVWTTTPVRRLLRAG